VNERSRGEFQVKVLFDVQLARTFYDIATSRPRTRQVHSGAIEEVPYTIPRLEQGGGATLVTSLESTQSYKRERRNMEASEAEVVAFSPTPAILVTPWIWLPLSFLVLAGLLFVSFRRQRAIELYHQGKH
jgi:hypothetical protein